MYYIDLSTLGGLLLVQIGRHIPNNAPNYIKPTILSLTREKIKGKSRVQDVDFA